MKSLFWPDYTEKVKILRYFSSLLKSLYRNIASILDYWKEKKWYRNLRCLILQVFSVWFSLQVEVNGQINDKDTINTDIQSGNKVKKEKKQVDFFQLNIQMYFICSVKLSFQLILFDFLSLQLFWTSRTCFDKMFIFFRPGIPSSSEDTVSLCWKMCQIIILKS